MVPREQQAVTRTLPSTVPALAPSLLAVSQASAMLSTIKLTPGVWYWKDDTNTLEFASSNPAAEENLKEGKNIPFQEMRVKTLKSIFQGDCSATLPERRLADKEGKLHRLSKWLQHEYVTLDDVKCE
ncbi:protein phosphatase 1 regulatory subunit 36-like [Morphnus guianensis]